MIHVKAPSDFFPNSVNIKFSHHCKQESITVIRNHDGTYSATHDLHLFRVSKTFSADVIKGLFAFAERSIEQCYPHSELEDLLEPSNCTEENSETAIGVEVSGEELETFLRSQHAEVEELKEG